MAAVFICLVLPDITDCKHLNKTAKAPSLTIFVVPSGQPERQLNAKIISDCEH